MTNRAPLIVAIVPLLLLVLYVASYLGVVRVHHRVHDGLRFTTYPGLGRFNGVAQTVYWPLAWIDMQVRPNDWCDLWR
jgi:hypothetical protein